MRTLMGVKIGMTQVINDKGVAVPVTLVKVGPLTVTQIKTAEKDGYNAVQVAYGQGKNLSKSVLGHVKAAKVEPKTLKEIRVDELPEGIEVGTVIDTENFELGDMVSATGISKGKGFAGGIKRHNFNRHKKTHGGKGNTRKPGSIGSMYPQKVFKGKRMAGRMGHDRVTVKNLEVVYLDKEVGLVGLKGAVPGPKRGFITIGGKV